MITFLAAIAAITIQADAPLTSKERAESAKTLCMETVQAVSGHLEKDKFRPRITALREGKAQDTGSIFITISGGDKHRTSIVCICRVRDSRMQIDSISFVQKTKPIQDHPSRAENADSLENILQAWVTEFNGSAADAIMSKWNSNKLGLQKINQRIITREGGTQFQIGGSHMDTMSFSVNLHPSQYFPE